MNEKWEFDFVSLWKMIVCLIGIVFFDKSELFQDDIYPDTASDQPAISGEDWFRGVDANPVLVGCQILTN